MASTNPIRGAITAGECPLWGRRKFTAQLIHDRTTTQTKADNNQTDRGARIIGVAT